MFCGNCGNSTKEDQAFCSNCGTKVEKETSKVVQKQFCGNCGNELAADEVFCGNCGSKNGASPESEVTPTPANVAPQTVAEPVAQETPKQGEKRKKKKGILVKLLILLVLVAGAGYYYLHALTSPDAVVKEFCKTLQNGDFEKMFATLDFPESDYITKEIFADYMNSGFDEGEGVDGTVEWDLVESSSKERVYELIYTIDDDEIEMEITLIKRDERKWFLFDDWRIEMEDMVIEEWKVTVPEGATVYLSGIEVKDDKTTKDGKDTYVVENLLGIQYEVKVTHPLVEEYKSKAYPFSNLTVELDAKEDLRSELEEYLESFIKIYYEEILGNTTASTNNNTPASSERTSGAYEDIFAHIAVNHDPDIYSNLEEYAYEYFLNIYSSYEYADEAFFESIAEDVIEDEQLFYDFLERYYPAQYREYIGTTSTPPAEAEKPTKKPSSSLDEYVKDDKAYTNIMKQGETIKKSIVSSLSYSYTKISVRGLTVKNFDIETMTLMNKDTIKLNTSFTLEFEYMFNDNTYSTRYTQTTSNQRRELTIVNNKGKWEVTNIE